MSLKTSSQSVWLVGVMGLLLGTTGCGGGAPAPAAGGPPGGMAMPVEIATLEAKPVDQATEFIGAVKSLQSTTVQPQAEGYLTKLYVKAGDRVTAGQALFDIDSTSQQALVANLQSVRAARESDVSLAKQRAARAKSLLDAGAGTLQDLEAATAAVQSADAQLKSLDEQIRQQKNELGYYKVTAPVAGVLGDIPVRQGDRVTRTTKLTAIESGAGLEIYIQIPMQQAPKLKLGLPVRVSTTDDSTPTTEHITFIAPSVDDTTQTLLVKAAVRDTKGLRTDQFVRTRVIWSTEPMLTVPTTAVIRVAGQFFVYTAAAERGGLVAHQTLVDLGEIVNNAYVVKSGIKAGDRVITGGIQKIGDGAPVSEGMPGAGRGAAEKTAGGK